MVINFKTRGISRDACKLTQTPVKLKKIYNNHLHENQENKVPKKKKKSKNIRAGRNQISPNFADCIGTSCK